MVFRQLPHITSSYQLERLNAGQRPRYSPYVDIPQERKLFIVLLPIPQDLFEPIPMRPDPIGDGADELFLFLAHLAGKLGEGCV
jgi:hypothetical protein